MTTTQLELCNARRQVKLIVGNQNFIRVDAIKRRHCRNGFTAQVHVNGR